MGLIDYIYVPFEYLMKGCLWISQNSYFFALFFFALAIEIVLIPLSIKQQKSSIQQAKIRPKEMAIREKYKGRTDKVTQQKMNMEIQNMYQETGYNQFSGCLPLLIQLPIILILFTIVRNPITYASNITKDNSNFVKESAAKVVEFYEAEKAALVEGKFETSDEYKALIKEIEGYEAKIGAKKKDTSDDDGLAYDFYELDPSIEAKTLRKTYAEMYVSRFILKGEDEVKTLVAEGKLDSSFEQKYAETELASYKDRLPNYQLWKLDLINKPDFKENAWLLLIPLLVFLTSFLSTKIMRKLQPQPVGPDGNPAGGGLFLEVGMPLITAIFAYSLPATIGVYWIWRTVIGIGKSFLMAKVMPIPQVTEEQLAEARKELKGKQKKKKVITIEVDEDDDSFNDRIVSGPRSSGSSSNNNSSDPSKRTPRRIEMLTADDDDKKAEPENKGDGEEKNDG